MLRKSACGIVIAIGLLWAAGQSLAQKPAEDAKAIQAALLEGVREIAAPGIPGPLCVHGKLAFPIVAGKLSKNYQAPVVAAAKFGQGRVVAFGHNGYFDAATMDTADTGTLMTNAVAWTAGRRGKNPIRVATVGKPQLAAFFKSKGFAAADVDLKSLNGAMRHGDVIVIDAAHLRDQQTAAALLAFIKKGGGAILGSLGWGWAQLNPGKSLVDDHPGNRFLAEIGIAWADGYFSRTGEAGYVTPPDDLSLLCLDRAIAAVVDHQEKRKTLDKDSLAQAAMIVSLAIRTLPTDGNASLAPLVRWAKAHGSELVPTPKQPIRLDDGLKRLALAVQLVEAQRLPADRVRAHPAASIFPGAVPANAKRVQRQLTLNAAVPGWHSTGLYAAPGEVLEITIPADAVGKNLFVRIGCHSDKLWDLDQWRRCPEITTRVRLSEPRTRVASPFGGLVYIEMPGRNGQGDVAVGVRGAIEAPYFVLGQTTAEQWKTIRQHPAPWAELASDRVIVSVPSQHVRDLDDPAALMEVWNQVLDACADLAAIPRTRQRPERYAADEQISAGYMHSGYPIMTHLDAAASMASRERLLAGNWGLFHEMGHNHQRGEWTFDGTGEVTCNLFSLYVTETVCKLDNPGHGAVQLGEKRRKAYEAYRATGPDFQKWQSDPFLALTMYLQLREGFGWDAYKKVFAEYRDLPDKDRPKSDAEKRDQWMVRFSRTVGRNLGPFFDAWGIPVTAAAKQSIADLPLWMPDGFPAPSASP